MPTPRPRVRANDWGPLAVPALHGYTPELTVSVVIPAYRAQDTLPYTLAALAAQSYPQHLLEVVVVDDDDGAPLDLPESRPDRTKVVRSSGSWGRASACATGASAADGDVIHWLDADMVPSRHQVAHHMRWHHALDHAVVLGHKSFVDPGGLPSVGKVLEMALDDRLADLFAGRWVEDHGWVEEIWQRTDDLRTAGFRAFHVHVGATASVRRDMYTSAGGLDTSLKLGEDIELGYRLAMKGAVFVGERAATSWHLGTSHLMRHEKEVQRYNAPFVAQRVPDFRKFRQERGRAYRVPYMEVVVEAEGRSWEKVKYTVDGVLRARPGDLRCQIVGPWSDLDDQRRHLLHDSQLDLRLVQEEYASEPRVSLVEAPPPTAFPAQFRLRLPAGWRPVPGVGTSPRVTREMQRRDQGLRSILLSDGQVARIERTAAFERALRVQAPGEELDDAVDAVSVTWWSPGTGDGFEHGEAPPAHASLEEPLGAPTDAFADPPEAEQVPESPTGDTRHPTVARLMAALGRR